MELHMSVEDFIKSSQESVNAELSRQLPPSNKEPSELHQAMHYAVLNGGKRLRSALVYATGEALGAKKSILNSLSSVLEMVHAFSLIHDDLPALDNDALRRGKPTCWKAFGEDTAILAGDALQSLGFEILAGLDDEVSFENKIKMIRILGHALGSEGMVGGEEMDLKMTNKTNVSAEELEEMYKLKTSCLITASILLGALGANCDDSKMLQELTKFGDYLGIAFQIHDDIIGIESDTETLGKQQGADLALNKPVYPLLVGMELAKKRREELYDKALTHLNDSGIKGEMLKGLAAYIIKRNY